MPFDPSSSHAGGTIPPEAPPASMPSPAGPVPPLNSQLLNSLAMRWIVIAAGLFGGGSVAGYSFNDGDEAVMARIASVENRLDANEARLTAHEERLVKVIESNETAMKAISDVAMLALELAVDGHRYSTDTLIDAVRLDHPDFVPRDRPDRLARRLDRGAMLLDEKMYPR